jgi:hypothetical protein|tara:strand:+ start:385 stop:600 length:216 start_codon:yes stop_codon:yes gene_type:complete
MCTEHVRKEANRLNWIVKGHLIHESWSDEDVEKTYHSYFKRLWGNHEAMIHEDGFEEAYDYRKQTLQCDIK